MTATKFRYRGKHVAETLLDVTGPRHPEVVVDFTGMDSNAFMILGTVQRALRKAGYSKEVADEYFALATEGDYDHLLQVTLATVTVEFEG